MDLEYMAESPKDKWIIFYASCGEGHKKVAYGLAENLNISVCDILDFSFPFLKLVYSKGYNFIARRTPFLWKVLFELSKNDFFIKILHLWHKFVFKSFFDFLSSSNYEIVISTHFFIPSLVSSIKKRKRSLKNIVIITDFGVHPIWKEKDIDLYFVAFSETKYKLTTLGINKDKIVVSGFPLRRGFMKRLDIERLRERFFKKSDKEILLFLSSSWGDIPFLEKVVTKLKKDFNIIVIYGKNRKLKNAFRFSDSSLRLFSYYEKIWELMKISLIIITKPGGATSFEALFLKKPLIITHLILGQEEENYKLLERWKVAFRVSSASQLIKKIYYIKNNYSSILKRFPKINEGTQTIKEKIEEFLNKDNGS